MRETQDAIWYHRMALYGFVVIADERGQPVPLQIVTLRLLELRDGLSRLISKSHRPVVRATRCLALIVQTVIIGVGINVLF